MTEIISRKLDCDHLRDIEVNIQSSDHPGTDVKMKLVYMFCYNIYLNDATEEDVQFVLVL